jgi:hypothetical protein
MRTVIVIAFCSILAISIGACRKEERNRITLYEKGVYLGEQDQKLSETQVRDLDERVIQQGW